MMGGFKFWITGSSTTHYMCFACDTRSDHDGKVIKLLLTCFILLL